MNIEYIKNLKNNYILITIYWVFYDRFMMEDISNKKENSHEITIKIIIFYNKIDFYLQALFLEFSIGQNILFNII